MSNVLCFFMGSREVSLAAQRPWRSAAKPGREYVPAVARSDVNPVVWQATVAQAAVVEGLKSAGSSTAPGVRLARVATSTRYAIGSMPQTLAVSTRL